MDLITAFGCCKYPKVTLLKAKNETKIRPEFVEIVRQEVQNSKCHLVTAAPPGKEDKRMRISTSFLEKALMRCLTDEQGQVYVVLKYLIKIFLETRVPQSLKTYHAKTLLFHLLNETEPDEWSPSNILRLTERGLHKLVEWLQQESGDETFMRHFFLPDAWVYLKRDHPSKKHKIAQELTWAIDHLPQLMEELRSKLRSLIGDGEFIFHPFLILPAFDPQKIPNKEPLPYHSVSDVVRSLLLKLCQDDCSLESKECLLAEVRTIPDFAATAKYSLKALIYLKYELIESARKVLRKSMGSKVSTGISVTCATKEDIWKHLGSTDSAWKFVLWFEAAPKLNFLKESVSLLFPYHMQYVEWYFMNMRALHRCLCLLYEVADDASKDLWFKDVLDSSDPDVQELAMTLEFCKDQELMVRLIHKHKRIVCDNMEIRWRVMRMICRDATLKVKAIRCALDAAITELEQEQNKRIRTNGTR